MHSEKKGYQTGAPGVLLRHSDKKKVKRIRRIPAHRVAVPNETVPLGHWGTEIVPLRVLYYGQPNSAPRGTVSVTFFF